jgi:hypothetical protein
MNNMQNMQSIRISKVKLPKISYLNNNLQINYLLPEHKVGVM